MIKCENCKGYCCRVIGRINPELDRGDLVCKHFDEETHRCKIYEHRPLICNTDILYETFYKDMMSREEYDRINAQGCASLTNYFENNK